MSYQIRRDTADAGAKCIDCDKDLGGRLASRMRPTGSSGRFEGPRCLDCEKKARSSPVGTSAAPAKYVIG